MAKLIEFGSIPERGSRRFLSVEKIVAVIASRQPNGMMKVTVELEGDVGFSEELHLDKARSFLAEFGAEI